LDACETGAATGLVAWHSLANFHYLVHPHHGSSPTKAFLRDLLRFIHVVPTSTDSARYALNLPMRDFEDALQVVAAIGCKANVIATRNVRDYERAPIRSALPSTVASELSE
jgi:hypothetical protein